MVSRLFAAALVSDRPHGAIPPEDQIFAPFIGSWDLVVSWFDSAGALSRRQDGEWHFAWVLEGRGIQDVWIVPPRAQRTNSAEDYEYGTSLRFFDPEIAAWRSTWIGPMHQSVRTFIARRIGDRVVLETAEDAIPRMRWSFSDISDDAFSWANEVWESGHWRLQQSFAARRRG